MSPFTAASSLASQVTDVLGVQGSAEAYVRA